VIIGLTKSNVRYYKEQERKKEVFHYFILKGEGYKDTIFLEGIN